MQNKPQLKDLDLASKYELDDNYVVLYKDNVIDDWTPDTRITRTGDVMIIIEGHEYFNHHVIAELYQQIYHPVPAEVDTREINDFDFE